MTGLLLVLLAIPMSMEAKAMSRNGKYLDEARAHAGAFEERLDPEELEAAYLALENVQLLGETDPGARNRMRADSLHLWMKLVALLDGLLDPAFDPADVPPRKVQPPPTPGGVVLPPGADPARIDDPETRAQYEKDIADNRARSARYALQTELRFLEERIVPRAKRFIRDFYTPAARDRAELQAAVDQYLKDSPRRSDFLNPGVVKSPHD